MARPAPERQPPDDSGPHRHAPRAGSINAFKAFLRALLIRWIGLVCGYRGIVVASCLVIAVAGFAYVLAEIRITTDPENLIATDLPYRQGIRELRTTFADSRNQLVVVIESEDADRVMDTARALAERMRSRPDLFQEVSSREDDPFFRRNGLLFKDLTALEDLVDRLAAAQPFLGALQRDPSLRGLFDLLTRIAEEEEVVDSSQDDIARVFESVAEVAEAQEAGRPASLSWRQLIAESGDDDQPARRFLTVVPVFDYSMLRPASRAIETVRGWSNELAPDAEHPVSIRLTGEAALNDAELQTVAVGIGAAGTASLLAVVALLWIAFRSPRTTVAALVTLIVGLIWTAAYGVAVVGALNLISVAFAVLFIGLSVDFSIHFALRCREIEKQGRGAADTTNASLAAAATRVGGALTLAAAAAAIGFLSFLPTDYTGLAELGVIAAGGMAIALFLNFTLLPALLSLLKPRFGREVRWSAPWQVQLERQCRRFPWTLSVIAVVIAIASAVIARDAYFDFDPLHLKDQSSESVATLLELMDEDPTLGYAISVRAEDLEAAQQMASRVSDLDTVAGTRTLADFVPANQDAKLELITDLQLILGPSLAAEPIAPPTAAEELESTMRLQTAAVGVPATNGGRLSAAGDRLADAMAGVVDRAVDDPNVLTDLRTRLLRRLPPLFADLGDSLAADAFGLADLPEDLRTQWLGDNGQALLQIFPEEPVHRDPERLAAFVTEVRTIAPEASGPPVGIYEGGRAVVAAFFQAAAIAVLAIGAMLLIVLRSVRDTLMVFAPLILAALLTVASSVVLSIPFNFANVIVLPLLFGLGVAGSLHLVMRERAGIAAGDGAQPATSTPRAVVFSALTTIASFGSLSLSAHPGTASMGILLTVAIAWVLVCTLVFLPAGLALVGKGHH